MGLAYGPAKRSTNSNPVSDTECRPVRAPAQGRQREEQADPPWKNKTKSEQTKSTKGGETPPSTTRTRPPKQKQGGQERDTQPRSRAPTPQEAGKAPSQATPKATPTGPPKEKPEDRAAKRGHTEPRAAAHWRKGHPGHASTHPNEEVAGKKKKHRRNPNKRGRGDGDQETQGRDRQRPTPQGHDTTGPRTTHPPPQPGKKKGRGGVKPQPQQPPHTLTPQAAPPTRWRETDGAHARGDTPQHSNQKKSECRQNPKPHTRTANPSQERRSAAQTRVQAHTP